MPMGRHYGSFGKGFADALVQMMKLGMTMDLYRARAQYYKDKGWALTHPKSTKADDIASHTTPYTGPLGEGGQPSHPATGAWWTPDRMSHAVDRLEKEAGLSHEGASGLVARWSGIEAGAGPSAYNPKAGGHYGIGQWGPDRGGAEVGKLDFDGQLTHAINELNGPEKAAADVLRRASTPEEGSRGASMYERGEGWNASTGTDNFTRSTPTQRVMDAVAGGGAKPTTTTTADKTKHLPDKAAPTRTETVSAKDTGVKPGWDKIVNPTTDAEDKAAEAYKQAHPDWMKQYNAGKPPETDKTAQAAPLPGSYQVAGDTDIALTPEQAAKARADLEAHRAAPSDTRSLEDPIKQHPEATGGVDTQSASDPVAVPDESSERPVSLMPPYPQSTTYPQFTGIPSRPTQMGPESPYAPPDRSVYSGRTATLQPSDQPSSGVGVSGIPPAATINPNTDRSPVPYGPSQRTGAPPNVGITPSSVPDSIPPMGPEQPGRTELPLTYSHMPPQQNVRGQTAVGAPTSADKPSPTAQPVSSPAGPAVTQPSNQPGGLGPGLIRYEVPTSSASRAPIYTAGDLSHLWGPNPPLTQRAPQPVQPQQGGVPSGQILSNGPTPYPGPTLNPTGRLSLTGGNQAGPNDMRSVPTPMPPIRPNDLGDVATASRKGGPIQRFARGGIPSRPVLSRSTVRYQGGGGAQPGVTAAGIGPAPSSQSQANDWNAMTYAGGLSGMPYDNSALIGSMTNANVQNQQFAADWGAMTPAQQAIYASIVGGAAPPGPAPPAPAAPAPAPAPTPAPVAPTATNIVAPMASITTIDPTTTTTTGAPGVPNAIQAKSYDPNVDAQTGAGFANTSSTGGTNYSVGSDDLLAQTSPGTISGTILSAKGGPIRRFAKGGGIPSRPTMRFQAGGQTAGEAYLMSPGYIGPSLQGGWIGTPESQLAPNQQAWAATMTPLMTQWGQEGQADAAYESATGKAGPYDTSLIASQITPMPAAIWPSAPAAPTPLNEPAPTPQAIVNQGQPIVDIATIDPTATTTTGAPGLPNSIQAKSYDPNVDAQTGAGFANTSSTGGTNYSVGSNDLLQTTSPNTISGSNATILSAKGGPLLKRVTRRYDMGGGVDQSGDVSPSALGMPPGLSSGGQQPIPPYYYNPATYAGAGAPVGKGVTQTSAPVYTAGAIPSLPMARGGVVAFDDGGDVAPTNDMADLQNMAFMDMQDEREDAASAQPAPPPTPTSDKDPGWYINPQDASAQDASAQPAAQPAAQPSQGADRPYNDRTPPPDPTMPQGSDDAGNPSRGLIGAISSGLHWLGEHLGLVGGAQAHPAIATSPDIQTNRQQFANNSPDGATYFTHQNAEELNDINDPHHDLQTSYRNILGLEQGWKWAMARGDDATAGRLAASILHYSVFASQNLSDQAAKALYNGDIHKAIDYANQASDAVPDGRLVHMTLNPDGKTVTVQGKNLNGQVLWQQQGAAVQILERATSLGRLGKLQWNALESQAAKYDSSFAEAQKNRQANAIAQGKEDADKAAQAQANEQIANFGPTYDDQTAPPTAPTTAPPALTPANTPALPGPGAAPASPETAATAPSPGKSNDTTTAARASPPPDADSSIAATMPGAGRHGIPPTPTAPTPADVPAASAQDVDLEHNVAYQNIVAITQPKYFTADMRPIVGGRVLRPPPPIDQVTFKSYAPQVQAAYREREQQYQAAVQQNQRLMQMDIDGQRRDIAADITSRRDLTKQTSADVAAGKRTQAQIDAAAKIEENRRADVGTTRTYEEQAPLTPTQGRDTYKDTTPMAVTAALPRYAVYKSDGSLDEHASAQALGKAYDLPPTPGAAATGGLQRATTVANIASDAVTWNTHMALGDVHDLVDGLARGVYTIEGRPTPVTRHGQELDQFVVHQQQGDPGVKLFLPRQDGYRIASIKQEFANAQPKPPPAATNAPSPPAPTRAIPGPTGPDFWHGGRPPAGPGPALKLPERVPVEQMPPEQRQLYPELNQ